MRTTLDLPDPLFRRLKAKAAIEGVPLKQVLERLLVAGLAGTKPTERAATRLPFPSISTGGAVIGSVSNAEAFELMDQDLDPQGR